MKLEQATQSIKASGRKSLAPFFTAGYPDEKTTLSLIAAAAEAGCKVVELGIPFSDPIADGPTIQESSQRALEAGMTLEKTLRIAARAGIENDVAIVLMGYFNPILRMGPERFVRRAAEAGVAGLIVPDAPLEESAELRRLLADSGITLVDLIARTSPPERIERIAEQARGFIYLVSVTGVTGTASARAEDLDAFVNSVRRYTDRPLYVGFGVSDRWLAREATRFADGVIIGSALVEIIRQSGRDGGGVSKIRTFLREVQQTINPSEGSRS
jgi:tryptophan synthase alpha chain